MPVEPKSESEPQGRYYFDQMAAISLSVLLIALAVLLLIIARELSDPGWKPTGSTIRNRLLVDIFISLPPWARTTILGGLASVVVLAVLKLLLHAFDRKPDFTIGPDGISRNLIFRFQRMSWDEVQSVSLDGKTIKFVGPVHLGSRRKNSEIRFDSMLLKGGRDEVVNLVRHYRPDLTIEQLSLPTF